MNTKITEMDREQLRDYMRASRDMHRFDEDSVSWKRAFELARQGGLENMHMDCSGCIRKVHEWLNR